MTTRREALKALGVLAAMQWEADGYDPENLEDWDPAEGGTYSTGDFTPDRISASGQGVVAGWLLEPDDLDENDLEVYYDPSDVILTIEGRNDDVLAGALAALSPEQAREVAVALYQAAEELDRRPGHP